MATKKHQLAGRVSAAQVPNMVTFCLCGLGFWGEDITAADARLQGHIDSTTAQRQVLGDLLARMVAADGPRSSILDKVGLIGEGVGLMLRRERER